MTGRPWVTSLIDDNFNSLPLVVQTRGAAAKRQWRPISLPQSGHDIGWKSTRGQVDLKHVLARLFHRILSRFSFVRTIGHRWLANFPSKTAKNHGFPFDDWFAARSFGEVEKFSIPQLISGLFPTNCRHSHLTRKSCSMVSPFHSAFTLKFIAKNRFFLHKILYEFSKFSFTKVED